MLVVAGGIGLAPLRPAILALLADRERYGRLVLLYGGRSPEQLLYPAELAQWTERGLDVAVTVDSAGPEWLGHVGVVPRLVRRAAFDAERAVALLCGPEVMMRFAVSALAQRGVDGERVYVSMERNMQCGIGHCGHCQLGPTLRLPRRPGLPLERARAVAGDQGAVMSAPPQADAGRVEVRLLRRLPAEPARLRGRAADAGRSPADRLLPGGQQRDRRGSLRHLDRRGLDHHAAHDAERIQEVRRRSRALITIGACATAGGIQALRNFADVEDFTRIVYASPDYISTLATSTPISAHVPVDFELNGCPINKQQLLEVISALAKRRPRVARTACAWSASAAGPSA